MQGIVRRRGPQQSSPVLQGRKLASARFRRAHHNRLQAPMQHPAAHAEPSSMQQQHPTIHARKEEEEVLHVYAISDLHADHADNMQWLRNRMVPGRYPPRSVIMVAGDVSDSLQLLREVLELLKGAFWHVVFRPGNHELWVKGPAAVRGMSGEVLVDSLDKLTAIRTLCRQLGVHMNPVRLGHLVLLPLLSWHHQSWDQEPDIPGNLIPRASALTISDYARCVWPDHASSGQGSLKVAQLMDALNDEERAVTLLSRLNQEEEQEEEERAVTLLSHLNQEEEQEEERAVTLLSRLHEEEEEEEGGSGTQQLNRATGSSAQQLNGIAGSSTQHLNRAAGSSTQDGGSGSTGAAPGARASGVGIGAAAGPYASRDSSSNSSGVPHAGSKNSRSSSSGTQMGDVGDGAAGPHANRDSSSNSSGAPHAGSRINSGRRTRRRRVDVISMSHFLPSQTLLPEKRFLTFPNLAKAVGSVMLQERLRQLQPALHVFGHTHFGWDAVLPDSDVRCVQAPLCYPMERKKKLRSIRIDTSSDWQPSDPDPDAADTDPDDVSWLPLLVAKAHFTLEPISAAGGGSNSCQEQQAHHTQGQAGGSAADGGSSSRQRPQCSSQAEGQGHGLGGDMAQQSGAVQPAAVQGLGPSTAGAADGVDQGVAVRGSGPISGSSSGANSGPNSGPSSGPSSGWQAGPGIEEEVQAALPCLILQGLQQIPPARATGGGGGEGMRERGGTGQRVCAGILAGPDQHVLQLPGQAQQVLLPAGQAQQVPLPAGQAQQVLLDSVPGPGGDVVTGPQGAGQAAGGAGGGGGGERLVISSWRLELCPEMDALWSSYYKTHDRTPEDVNLAPWVAPRYARIKARQATRAVDQSTGQATRAADQSMGQAAQDGVMAGSVVGAGRGAGGSTVQTIASTDDDQPQAVAIIDEQAVGVREA